MDLQKQLKINKLEKRLFKKTIEKVINSNDIELMSFFVEYVRGKIYLSSTQYIYQKIFVLKDGPKIKSNLKIYYKCIDKKIQFFKNTVETF